MPASAKGLCFGRPVLAWYHRVARDLPWRLRWDSTRDPYVVWVSEVMLQQTTIQAVTPAYVRFLQQFPSVGCLARANPEQVRHAVRGLGYYRRFDFLHKAARFIVERKKWPQSYNEWLEVPGVGKYTASAMASITLNEVVPVVDGNVERVVARFLGLSLPLGSKRLKDEARSFMSKEIDRYRPGDFNQAIMELGQTICVRSSPNCLPCPIKAHCVAFNGKLFDRCPLPKFRKEKQKIELHVFAVLRKHDHGLQLGLVERGEDYPFLKNRIGFHYENVRPREGIRIGSFNHTITHHSIRVYVYVIPLTHDHESIVYRYFPIANLDKNVTSHLDHKALAIVLAALSRRPSALRRNTFFFESDDFFNSCV